LRTDAGEVVAREAVGVERMEAVRGVVIARGVVIERFEASGAIPDASVVPAERILAAGRVVVARGVVVERLETGGGVGGAVAGGVPGIVKERLIPAGCVV
jgi:hypothetical protein